MKSHLNANFLNSYQETLDRINQACQRVFDPITEAICINQESLNRFNSSVEAAEQIFSQNLIAQNEAPFVSCMKQLENVNVLSPIFTETINSFSSITSPLADALRSIDFDSFFAAIRVTDSLENFDDYIVTDSPVIRDIDFPDNIVIPMGHNRLRIRTDIFIAIISFLFTVFAFLSQNIGTNSSHEEARLPLEQNQLTKEQNQLLQEQNRLLLEILESVDTSMSSQAEFFKDMREFLQDQAVLFQSNPESSATVQESGDPTQTATGSIQKEDDLTPPTADTSPSAPNTGSDNE